MNKGIKIIFIVCGLLLWSSVFRMSAYSKKQEDHTPAMFLTCEIDKPNLYEGESAVITTCLYSKTKDITGFETIEPIGLNKGVFSYVSHVETDARPYWKRVDGEDFIVFPLESYLVTFHNSGNYEIDRGKIAVEYAGNQLRYDPFWGEYPARVKASKTLVPVNHLKIKVRPLPENKDVDDFSGVVGNFDVKVIIPPGKIFMKEPGLVIISVKGTGLLGDDVLPDYLSAFGEDAKLKSVSEKRKSYFNGKDIVSILDLECEFVPASKEVVIDRIKLNFFDPHTGKYKIAESDPVTVEVESAASREETFEI